MGAVQDRYKLFNQNQAFMQKKVHKCLIFCVFYLFFCVKSDMIAPDPALKGFGNRFKMELNMEVELKYTVPDRETAMAMLEDLDALIGETQ